MQFAMRYADRRTTLRSDIASASLDRLAAHYLARMSADWQQGSCFAVEDLAGAAGVLVEDAGGRRGGGA